MYSKEEISLQHVGESVVSDAVPNELEMIKKKTRTQLELLKQQMDRLKLFDANIDIDFAIKWYEIKSSQFSKLAYFYGQKGWIDRHVLHGEVLAGAVVLGLAVHALAFFMVVGAYYKLSEMLSEHYKVEEGNKESIKRSFSALSEGLRQAVESFNEMERKLDSAFSALDEQNESLSATIAQLGMEAGKLHAQVLLLESLVKQLQEQQKKILATTGKISDTGEKLCREMESLSAIILEKKAALDFISDTIGAIMTESIETRKQTTLSLVQTKEEKSLGIQQKTKCCELLIIAEKTIAEENEIISVFDKSLEKAGDVKAEIKGKLQSTDSLHERARRILAMSRSGVREKTEEPPESSPTALVF